MINEALNNIKNILLNLETCISKFVKMDLFDINPCELIKLKNIEQKFNWILEQSDGNFEFHFQKPFIMEVLKIVEYVIEQELHKDKGLINEFYKNAKNTHDIETNNRLEILYLIIMNEKCYYLDKYEVFPSIFNIAIRWSDFTCKTSINCYHKHCSIKREIERYLKLIVNQNI